MTRFGVVVLCGLGSACLAGFVLAAHASAQTTPRPSLTGEFFHVDVVTGGPIAVDEKCSDDAEPGGPNRTSVIKFSASGVATGPYPGPFTERGIVVLGPGAPGGKPVLTFVTTFSISSPVGTVRGTKRYAGAPQTVTQGFCDLLGTFLFASSGFTVLEYRATIQGAAGKCSDRGTAVTVVNNAPFLQEDFTSTTLTCEVQSPQ